MRRNLSVRRPYPVRTATPTRINYDIDWEKINEIITLILKALAKSIEKKKKGKQENFKRP